MSQDNCCFLCRGAMGICLTRHSCDHHREAAKQDEADAKARRTHRDPVADLAIYRADRSRKGKAR